jgi:hypothetical protein
MEEIAVESERGVGGWRPATRVGGDWRQLLGNWIKPFTLESSEIFVTLHNDLVNRIKHVDFGQTLVNLGHHLENLVNNH